MAAWSFRGLPPTIRSKSGIGTCIMSSVSFSECSLYLFPWATWFSKVRQLSYVWVLFKLTDRLCSSMSSSGFQFKGLEGKHLFLKGLNVLSLLFDMEISLLLVLFGGLGWNLGPRPTLQWWIRHGAVDAGNEGNLSHIRVVRLRLHKQLVGAVWVSPPPKSSMLSLYTTAECPISLEGPELHIKVGRQKKSNVKYICAIMGNLATVLLGVFQQNLVWYSINKHTFMSFISIKCLLRSYSQ